MVGGLTKITPWIKKHKVWTFVIAFVLLSIILGATGIINSSNNSSSTYSPTNSTQSAYDNINSNEIKSAGGNLSYTNESLVTDVLNLYGYNVINVSQKYDSTLGNYAIVEMYSNGSSIDDIMTQMGYGYGALYGVWNNKDYYIVSLNNYQKICDFGIDGQEMRKYMINETSIYELFNSITPACQNIS